MNEPPRPIGDMYGLVYDGIDAIGRGDEAALGKLAEIASSVPQWIRAHLGMEHSYPSPSGIQNCRLQQWYDAKGMEPDQVSPRGWKVGRAMGVLSEPYWMAVLASGGAEVELPADTLECGPYMQAHPDAVMDGEFLLEFKSVAGWGYKMLITRPGGVAMLEKAHYVQAQLYMYAAEFDWCLYLTYPKDFSQTQSSMRQAKRYGPYYELQPVYLEWIARDEAAIDAALERAAMLSRDQLSDAPPPREFSGAEFMNSGKRSWPCGYCLHLGKCNDNIAPERAGEGDDDRIAFV